MIHNRYLRPCPQPISILPFQTIQPIPFHLHTHTRTLSLCPSFSLPSHLSYLASSSTLMTHQQQQQQQHQSILPALFLTVPAYHIQQGGEGEGGRGWGKGRGVEDILPVSEWMDTGLVNVVGHEF